MEEDCASVSPGSISFKITEPSGMKLDVVAATMALRGWEWFHWLSSMGEDQRNTICSVKIAPENLRIEPLDRGYPRGGVFAAGGKGGRGEWTPWVDLEDRPKRGLLMDLATNK